MKTAIIIKGNPKYIDNNQKAENFYNDVKSFLEDLNYKVSFNSGKPYTTPPSADLWIGHSRGCDRLRFASKNTLTISLGTKGGINHPKDTAFLKDKKPNEFHYILTEEMKSEIIKLL
jgi:hypothetical protein